MLESKGGMTMGHIYLERNSGDDASCTMEDLKALLAKKG